MTAPLHPPPIDALLALRPIRLDDSAALHAACWPERNPQAVAEFLRRCAVQMQGNRALAVVADVGSHIVGFALLTYWRDMGEIGDLIVTEAWRSQGIGSALIDHLTDEAARRGVSRMEIGAAISNPRALALYKRLGFSEHHTVELDLGEGLEPVIYLSKSLS
jgi:ribosomal protein S18 acetylase RimI-like enzyme